MKTNPFYALSVSAMLLGCWLLSEALHLQAGQLGGLLLLMRFSSSTRRFSWASVRTWCERAGRLATE